MPAARECVLDMTRSYTHEFSIIWMPKEDLDNDETNWHAIDSGRKFIRPHPY